jgi:hypothetical protein
MSRESLKQIIYVAVRSAQLLYLSIQRATDQVFHIFESRSTRSRQPAANRCSVEEPIDCMQLGVDFS